MRKGQMEMIGLLMIVILLVVILGFYLKFSTAPKTDLTGSSLAKTQSASLLRAISKYSICPGNDMEKALETCVKDKNQNICGRNSCDLAESTTKAILEKYFVLKQDKACCVRPFSFFAFAPDGTEIFKIEGGAGCKEAGKDSNGNTIIRCAACAGRATVSESEKINVFPGLAEMKVYRCA